MQACSCLSSPSVIKFELIAGAALLAVAVVAAVAAAVLFFGAPTFLLGAAGCLGLSALPLSLVAGGLACLGAALIAASCCLGKPEKGQPVRNTPPVLILEDSPPSRHLDYKVISSTSIKNAINTKIEENINRLSSDDFGLVQEELKSRKNFLVAYELPQDNEKVQHYFQGNAVYLFVYRDRNQWEKAEAYGFSTILRLLIEDEKVTAADMVPCKRIVNEQYAPAPGEPERACQILLKLFGV